MSVLRESRRGALAGLFALAAARAIGQPGSADDQSLETIDDLRALALRVQRERIPLLVLFSTPACPYCLEVRRNYLRPRRRETPALALIREVDITSSRAMIDFSGKPITEADLAKRHGVRLVPVVLLLDAKGNPLAEPLIGADRAGFYEAHLTARLTAATHALRTAK